MAEILEVFISSVCMIFVIYYISNKLFCYDSYLNNMKTIMVLLFHIIIITILYLYAPNSLLRVISNVLIICIVDYLIFRKNLIKMFVASFIIFGIISFSEIIWTVFLMIGLRIDVETLKNFYFVDIAINAGIAVITFMIIRIDFVVKVLQKLLGRVNSNQKLNIVIWLLFCILGLTILFYYIYFQVNTYVNLILTFFLIICFTCLPLIVFKEKCENSELQVQREIMMDNLLHYESALALQYMKNHENNNNLISVRGMIKKNNQEAINFINSLLKVESGEAGCLVKISNIPIEGLRALIDQKIMLMDKKNVPYSLEISKKFNKNIMKYLPLNTITNICKITGVLLDNAIQAVENYEKKMVGIYLYKEKNTIVLVISNNYEGFLNVENFGDLGYTTKKIGNGSGYGLSLVKKILEEDPLLSNEKVFDGNIFSQILKINLKRQSRGL